MTEDLLFDGQVVIPAGTEVHGKAQTDRVRDRIAAIGSWTLIFSNGQEMIVDAKALHREESADGQHWGLDDGSAGLKGQVIKNASFEEIKLFAAAFLSGMSQGVRDTESTAFGRQAQRSVKNAALSGSSAVLDEYARSIAETIKRDGTYVRVPGGTTFYLYLDRTIDRSTARIGTTLLKK